MTSPDKHYLEWATWRWRRWRAAHHQWAAWINYLRQPTPVNAHALDRADDLVRQLEDNRP
jgi:hypothetical protein